MMGLLAEVVVAVPALVLLIEMKLLLETDSLYKDKKALVVLVMILGYREMEVLDSKYQVCSELSLGKLMEAVMPM
jgi:hypothetical protein